MLFLRCRYRNLPRPRQDLPLRARLLSLFALCRRHCPRRCLPPLPRLLDLLPPILLSSLAFRLPLLLLLPLCPRQWEHLFGLIRPRALRLAQCRLEADYQHFGVLCRAVAERSRDVGPDATGGLGVEEGGCRLFLAASRENRGERRLSDEDHVGGGQGGGASRRRRVDAVDFVGRRSEQGRERIRDLVDDDAKIVFGGPFDGEVGQLGREDRLKRICRRR